MSSDEPRAKREDLRRVRLAASLRENLKRRKAQSRARQVEAQPADEPTAHVWRAWGLRRGSRAATSLSAGEFEQEGPGMDRIQIRGGASAEWGDPDFRGEERRAAVDDRLPAHRSDADPGKSAASRRCRPTRHILGNHGVDYSVDGKRVGEEAGAGQTAHLRARTIVDTTAPYEMVAKMRASFWVIAPLLARMGAARVSLPGGCAIGTRPVDLLLMALEKLGAQIEIDAGYAVAKAPKGLTGAEIEFPKVTVGGTHIAIMAASTAHGATLIRNAACEPEVADLAACLNKMGARIRGAGTLDNRN